MPSSEQSQVRILRMSTVNKACKKRVKGIPPLSIGPSELFHQPRTLGHRRKPVKSERHPRSHGVWEFRAIDDGKEPKTILLLTF